MTSELQMPAEVTGTATGMTFEESSVVLKNGSERVLQAGQGEPLVLLPGSDGLHLSRGHELLARMCHVIALDILGAGQRSTQEKAGIVLDVLDRQALEHVSLLSSALAAAEAVEISRQRPDTSERLSQEGYWQACQAFTASLERRTCSGCGHVHPEVDLSEIRWQEIAAQLRASAPANARE